MYVYVCVCVCSCVCVCVGGEVIVEVQIWLRFGLSNTGSADRSVGVG